MVTTPCALPMARVWNREPGAAHDESQGTQGSPPPARFLLTSLVFHGETIHAKTKIARNGAGSHAHATCAKRKPFTYCLSEAFSSIINAGKWVGEVKIDRGLTRT